MREYMCRYLDCDPDFRRISEQDRYEVGFRFSLCPSECFIQPDEDQHVEQLTIKVTLHGLPYRSMRFHGERLNNPEKMKVLYWHAVKAIEEGEDSVEIDADYAAAHAFDPAKIVYPPTAAFPVTKIEKMGFHA